MNGTTLIEQPATTPDRRSHGAACRACGDALSHPFLDLGMSPLCESYVPADRLNAMEAFYPLRVHVCESCLLVQLEEYVSPEEIFTEYAYFSSYSKAWLEHCEAFVDEITARLDLGPDSQVVELGSNDGYLLQYFAKHGVPALGIDPARNVAEAARARGVETITAFFGESFADDFVAEHGPVDLVIGNNVLAQVTDLNGFVAGIARILAPGGHVSIEVPHLLNMIEKNQFDTIYHEHFSYFSLHSAEWIFARHGLTIHDVEELWTHGGSLRLHARPTVDATRPVSRRVAALRDREKQQGLDALPRYLAYEQQVRETKWNLLDYLIEQKRAGKTVVGYGAPGKGNTLLNYCGIRTDLLDYTVDRNPHKHGLFLPGTHIPIHAPERIAETRPDVVLILPWNLRDEIVEQLAFIREWGGRFVVPIPEIEVIA